MKKPIKAKHSRVSLLNRTLTVKQFILLAYIPLIVTITLFAYAGWIFRENYKIILDDPSQIRELIISAASNLTTEAPIVPNNELQYLPEMKLSFARDKAKIAYTYTPKNDDSSEFAIITSTALKGASSSELYSRSNIKDLFDSIPAYQNCQRPYILTSDDQPPVFYSGYLKSNQFSFETRTIYVWESNEQLCKADDGVLHDELAQTIQSMRSY